MQRKAGTSTSTGAPAPIFVPVIEASKVALGNVGQSLYAIYERITNDIQVLRSASEDTLYNDELGAASIHAIDPDFAGGALTQLSSASAGTETPAPAPAPTLIQSKVTKMEADPIMGEFRDAGMVDLIDASPRRVTGVQTKPQKMEVDPATDMLRNVEE